MIVIMKIYKYLKITFLSTSSSAAAGNNLKKNVDVLAVLRNRYAL
jgi:hypothetical protein